MPAVNGGVHPGASEISELRSPPRPMSLAEIPRGTQAIFIKDFVTIGSDTVSIHAPQVEPLVLQLDGTLYLAKWAGKASSHENGDIVRITFAFADGTERELQFPAGQDSPVARTPTESEKRLWQRRQSGENDPLAELIRLGDSSAGEICIDPMADSGSGILDLTRESDDTALGAELLEEIYVGDDSDAGQLLHEIRDGCEVEVPVLEDVEGDTGRGSQANKRSWWNIFG